MYDRGTYTLWSQLLGKPVVGPLVDSGIKLKLLPVVLTTWEEWLREHPDTDVLSLETGYYSPRQYQPEDDPRSIYFQYRNTGETMFPVPLRDARLKTKDYVLGVTLEGRSRAYPIEVLQRERLVNDALGGREIVVVASPSSQEAWVYERRGQTFRLPPDTPETGLPPALLDREGRRWSLEDDALVLEGNPSERLDRLPSHVAYWFGWYAFHADTDVYPGR